MLYAAIRTAARPVNGQRLILSRRPLVQSKTYATAPAAPAESQNPIHSTPATSTVKQQKLTSLSSIEASWTSLPQAEQNRIYEELAELQKKDWKELSIDEKKAAYYISYGPHGPRAPIVPPNSNGKVFAGVIGCIATAGGVFALVRSQGQETPKTLTKEWREAQTEYARDQKMDPFTGVAKADGKGKTYH